MNSFSIWHVLIVFVLAAILFVTYLYAKSYKSLIETIGGEYISTNPNLVFLIFIPMVGFVFYIVLAFLLKNSLGRMFQDGKISVKADAVFISLLASLICAALTAVPLISQFMALVTLMCIGFNWSHVVNARKLILKCKAAASGNTHPPLPSEMAPPLMTTRPVTPPPLINSGPQPLPSVAIMISRAGEQFGPYSEEDLRAYLGSGQVLPDDLAWTEGMESWLPVSQILPTGIELGCPTPACIESTTGRKREV
jgi:hypothetical protein